VPPSLFDYRGNVEPTIRKEEFAMPQKERLRVWRNEIKKTSGGLTRDQLVKNKRGKIVSKKKSSQAVGDSNNLGSWLRSKGDKFKGKPKGFKEAAKDDRDDEKLAEVPAKAKPKKAAPPKKKAAPPKKKAAAPKKKAAAVVDLTDSPVKAAKPKAKKKKKMEPMKAGEKKEMHKISVGNILSEEEKVKGGLEKARKEMRKLGFSDKEIDELLSGGGSKNAAKVRKLLKASKRRGKRRTKKQLLQDVLDVI